MPHDMHGRKIELGDTIKTKPYNQPDGESRQHVGKVVDMHSQEQTCTGQMQYLAGNLTDRRGLQLRQDYFGAGESELILKADGSEPEAVKTEPLRPARTTEADLDN